MNLTEALKTALPDLPVRLPTDRAPRKHPNLVGREHVLDGEPLVRAVISGRSALFQFTPAEWAVVQLFDGQRTYQEIADQLSAETGAAYASEEVREFAAKLAEAHFWYSTPLERSTTGSQRLKQERSDAAKRKKSKFSDLSQVFLSGWDPDAFLDKAHAKLYFIYTPWFTLLTLAVFTFMAYVFVDRWSEIGADSLRFYNFREKNLPEALQFWALCAFVLCLHEVGHGLSCKHYGGHVHRMGFGLVYLMPVFYTDITEVWVYGGPKQRWVTALSGSWTELLICAAATPIWWATPYGSILHSVAYNLMLITGVGVIFFNWNPLIKLDGYYLLTDYLDLPDLKEDSTVYTASLVKRYLWRMPVQVPFVRKRRRVGYVIYALASGLYSYSLLYFFTRFIGNILRSVSPEWYFVPAIYVGYLVFRSRLRTLGTFMKALYLDKKDYLRGFLSSGRGIALSAGVLLVMFLPLWRESLSGHFILEPGNRAVLRTEVGGRIAQVYGEEGQAMAAGAPVLRLTNLEIESEAAHAEAEAREATARATQARLAYNDFAAAERHAQELEERSRLLAAKEAKLEITSPIAGQVVTPRMNDALGSYVAEGTEVADIADLSSMRARVYVPEFEMHNAHVGNAATLHLDALVGSIAGQVNFVAPVSSEVASGLIEETPYKGIRPPTFYAAIIQIPNPQNNLRVGMTGIAKIYGGRSSIAGFAWRALRDMVARKIW